MKRWITTPLGALEALASKEVSQALDFIKARKFDLVKVFVCSWGFFLLGLLTLIYVVRLALHLPL